MPAPIASVRIGDLDARFHPQPCDAIVDTGSWRTAVPARICHELGLRFRERRTLPAFDPALPSRDYNMFAAVVEADGERSAPLLVAAVDELSHVLLGRDFLSEFNLMITCRGRWAPGRSATGVAFRCCIGPAPAS